MAGKYQQTFTLNLDFNVEKAKINEIGALLDKNLGKKMGSGKGDSYLQNIATTASTAAKEATKLYKIMEKPIGSKAEAQKFGKTLEEVFEKFEDKILSLQGNVTRTMNSIGNAESLKQIRVLGNEISKMLDDYQTVTKLNAQIKSLGNKGEINKQINKANKELKPLQEKQKTGALSKAELKLQTELNKAIEEGNRKLAEKNELNNKANAILAEYKAASAGALKGQIDDKIAQQNSLTDSSLSLQDFNTLKQILSDLRLLISGLVSASKNSTAEIIYDTNKQEEAWDRAADQARTFDTILKSLGINFSLDFIIQQIKEVARYSYEYIKNLDAALTEISVVSNKTREEALALTDTFIELSRRTGMAIDDIAQASTIFYQQGLSDAAVEKMTEWTALFAKISNETVPEAADQLTAAINGFGFATEQVGDVVDKMSVLAAYSAADINELATAMSKGASAAAQAGLSFDQYNAYLATMIETTREAPENIGTSLKTIMARFQQVKEAGTTEDGETDVNKVETALKSVGIQLRDSQGELRELGDVLEELGPKWNSLDRNTQAYLGTVIAGTRQQSRFISLMQNWDRALELTEASENSAGAAARMHAKAMDGLEASLNNLTNAWQKLISSMADGDTLKWIIDIGAEFLEWLAEGNTLIKMFGLAMAAINFKTLIKNINAIRQNTAYKNLDTTLSELNKTTLSYKETLKNLAKEHSDETRRIQEQTQELNNLADALNRVDSAQDKVNGNPDIDVTGDTNPLSDGDIINNKNEKTKVNIDIDPTKNTEKKFTTFASNISKLMGNIQTFLTGFSIGMSLVEEGIDLFTTTAEEMREAAQEQYDETLKIMDKQLNAIEAIESYSDVYDNLSNKLNKSAEEVEQLAEAAEALAEAAPGAVIGYDSEGNPIISTNVARASKESYEAELAEAAKDQIGNIGALGLADLREEAEKEVAKNNPGYDNAQTAGAVTAGVGAGVAGVGLATGLYATATVGAANAWNPAGWVILAGVAIAGLGAAIAGTATGMEEAAISAEELQKAQDKATEIQKKYRAEVLQNMGYITDNYLTDRNINGTTETQRSEVAAFLGDKWLGAKEQELLARLQDPEDDFDGKDYEVEYRKLGQQWADILSGFTEGQMANAYTHLENVIEDIGSKSYTTVEEAIIKIIKNDMGISEDDELFQVMKQGFLSAAYNGIGGGIDKIVADLETRKANNPNDADAYTKAINAIKEYTAEQASFVSETGLLDNVDVFNSVMGDSGFLIKSALSNSQTDATLTTIDALETYKAQQEQILKDTHNIVDWTTVDMATLTDEQKKLVKNVQDATAAIETSWGSLPYSASKTWESLLSEYEKITSKTKTAYSTLHKLTSGEGLNYDDFKDFVDILDNINLEAFDAAQVKEYSSAIDKVTKSLYVENGALHMNANAVKDIASLEKMLSDIEKQKIKNTLISRRTELEASYAVIQAEIATLEYKIAEAEGSVDASDKKVAAEEAWNNASIEINKVFDANQAKIATAMVGHFSSAFTEVATKYNQLITGMNGEQISENTLNNFKDEWEEVTKDLNFESYEKTLDNKNILQLKNNLKGAKQAAESVNFQISNINFQLAALESGILDTAKGTAEASKAADEYISKLERFLELLKHIEREQQNLSVAEMFEDEKTGSAAIAALDRQLKYTQHLIGDTKELYLAYEKEASTQAATVLKGYGDMVKFDKWGNYSLDVNKYNALSSEKQEQLDKLLETYDDLVEKRDEYYNSHLDYIIAERDNQQKRVDLYIKAEDEIVEAIKQREQKILDNKLAAIDKEIEAIEKASEARRKAREEEDEAEELSSLQTDLQRALMDSSGASASQILEIQKQIKDKQQEMADESFDTMVDDMKTQLEEEKEMEQKLFDERLEEMDWYWNEVGRIMEEGTESVLDTMQLYLDDFNQASELQQVELLKGWQDTFEKAATIGHSGAKELQTVISELQTEINALEIDEDVLTDEAINTKFEKRPQTDEDKKPKVSGNTNGGVITSGGGQKTGGTYTVTFKDGYTKDGVDTQTVKKGSSTAFPNLTRDGYRLVGWNDTTNKRTITNYNGSYTPDGDAVLEAIWEQNSSKVDLSTITKKQDYTASSKGNQITTGLIDTGADVVVKNASGNWAAQAIWKAKDGYPNAGKYFFWKGSSGKYQQIVGIDDGMGRMGDVGYKVSANRGKIYSKGHTRWLTPQEFNLFKNSAAPGFVSMYKNGGMADFTGPAWLDGTKKNPEAVLNSMQTKAFLSFTDDLAALRAEGGISTNSSVVIDNISFNVESMSSVADGEKAFDAFVDKFKEIGAKQGISILGTSNRN